MKLGIVGDLSQGDPANLARALDAALAAADFVVQLGDMNPGYAVFRERLAKNPDRLFAIPGNHDTQGPGNWDAELPGLPKQWVALLPTAVLIGLDNSADRIDEQAYGLLTAIHKPVAHLFVALHKPLSSIRLPDGSVTNHIMGGDSGAICGEALRLMDWAIGRDVTFLCGHYHAWALEKVPYGTVVLEGRGGAASQVGYTLLVTDDAGWTAHEVTL